MVAAGQAAIAETNGRVKAIRLVASAATHAIMIGPPGDGRADGVKFTRKSRLDIPAIVWEHHPRCTYPAPE
jgi:hypothetical protein